MPIARRDGDDLVLDVRVQPRASSSGIVGPHGDRIRVRLRSPPVDGRANAELVELLADAFGVTRARVVLDAGASGRDKRVRILGVATLPPPYADWLEPR